MSRRRSNRRPSWKWLNPFCRSVATVPPLTTRVGPLAGTLPRRGLRTSTRSPRTRPNPSPPPRTRRSSSSAAGWQRTAASTPRPWPRTPRRSWARVDPSDPAETDTLATWPSWTTATGPSRSRRCTSRRSRRPWPRVTSMPPSRRARWVKMTRSAPLARGLHSP